MNTNLYATLRQNAVFTWDHHRLAVLVAFAVLAALCILAYIPLRRRLREYMAYRNDPLRADKLLPGLARASRRPSDYKETSLAPHRAMSINQLERELRNQILDERARERLIADATTRRNLTRAGAIRLVLEELDAEHRRYG